MNENQKDYLLKRGAILLDNSEFEDYIKTMNEVTVPKIIEDIKQSEQLAAELRFMPTTRVRRKKKSS